MLEYTPSDRMISDAITKVLGRVAMSKGQEKFGIKSMRSITASDMEEFKEEKLDGDDLRKWLEGDSEVEPIFHVAMHDGSGYGNKIEGTLACLSHHDQHQRDLHFNAVSRVSWYEGITART